jgi:hypothetical protein
MSHKSKIIVIAAAAVAGSHTGAIGKQYKDSPIITCAGASEITFINNTAKNGFTRQLDYLVASNKFNEIHCVKPLGDTSDHHDFFDFARRYTELSGLMFKEQVVDGLKIVQNPKSLVCHNGSPIFRNISAELLPDNSWQIAMPGVCTSFTADKDHSELLRASVRAAIENGIEKIVFINHIECRPFFKPGQEYCLRGRAKLARRSFDDIKTKVQGAEGLQFQFVVHDGDKFHKVQV